MSGSFVAAKSAGVLRGCRRVALFGLVSLSLAACSHLPRPFHRKKPLEKPEAQTDDARHQLLGTVTLADETNGFVLIDMGSYVPPPAGQALKTFSGEAESGVLAVSPERRPPFVVADIVRGAPKRGDSVYQ